MPIYEYVCEACGRLTEVMQKVNDPAPAACPECGAPKLAKLVSRTTFQLKGGGWYSDLYSSPKAKDGAAAKPKPDAGAAGKKEAPASPAAAPAGSGSGGGGSGSGGSGSGGGPSAGGASRKSG